MASTAFRYITDALTPEEAIQMLKAKEASKAEREAKVREVGYVHFFLYTFWEIVQHPTLDTLLTLLQQAGSDIATRKLHVSPKKPSKLASIISK